MSLRKILLIVGLTLLLPLAQAFAQTDFGVSLDFHSALSPYGSWLNVGGYGECWRPFAGANFMPFTDDGYWDYTDYGPTWTSDEPWAWAAYHYGQWVFDPNYGWVWVPGYTWEAAPVEWAYGPGYIGWSPFLGAGFNDVNLFVFLNGNDWGDHDYGSRLIRGPDVRQVVNTGSFRLQRTPLARDQVQTITHRAIQPVPVQRQTVSIDGHTTTLVVPQNRADRVMAQVRQAARNRQMSENRNTMGNQRTVPENRPMTQQQQQQQQQQQAQHRQPRGGERAAPRGAARNHHHKEKQHKNDQG